MPSKEPQPDYDLDLSSRRDEYERLLGEHAAAVQAAADLIPGGAALRGKLFNRPDHVFQTLRVGMHSGNGELIATELQVGVVALGRLKRDNKVPLISQEPTWPKTLKPNILTESRITRVRRSDYSLVPTDSAPPSGHRKRYYDRSMPVYPAYSALPFETRLFLAANGERPEQHFEAIRVRTLDMPAMPALDFGSLAMRAVALAEQELITKPTCLDSLILQGAETVRSAADFVSSLELYTAPLDPVAASDNKWGVILPY